MIMETIENIKKKIKPIAEKYGVGKVILFGSYARGEEKASSDLDFMISKGKIRGAFGLCCFIDDLQHQFDLPIDVITDSVDDDYILGEARKDGIVVYGE